MKLTNGPKALAEVKLVTRLQDVLPGTLGAETPAKFG
jgi:hypothetical protein